MSAGSCEAVRDALRTGRQPSDPELEKHAAECAQCSALLDDRAALGRVLATDRPGSGESLPWSDMETLLQEEVGWRAWLRSRPHQVRVLFATAGFALVGLLGLLRPRADLAHGIAYETAGMVLFGVVAAAALPRALPVAGHPPKRGLLAHAVLALALGLPIAAALVHATAATPDLDLPTFVRRACGCFSYGSLLTIPLVTALWLLDRGAGPRSRLYYGAAAAGLAANLALLLHCPNTSSAHLLLGHATIGLALAAVAWLVAVRR